MIRHLAKVSHFFQPTKFLSKNDVRKNSKLPKGFQLMIDAGIISNLDNGLYTLLPLGLRSLEKLIKIVESEINIINGQKIILPSLTPANLWEATDRLNECKSELFTVNDKHNKKYILGPTFEEAITYTVSKAGPLTREQLPLRLYQNTTKWRDELKPRLGFLRSREFLMNDLYTFDQDLKNAESTFELVSKTYCKIFNRIGIPFAQVDGDSGTTGGSKSHEYFYKTDIGEDVLRMCDQCEFHENSKVKVNQDESCPLCKKKMKQVSAVEIGHTFLLGEKYSKPLNALYISEDNKKKFLQMGCYGIGLTRLITAATEILSTESEIRWPVNLAPYSVCIIPPKTGSIEQAAAELVTDLYSRLSNSNIDAVIDDRSQYTIGKRIVDARQSGYPFIIVAGKCTLKSNPQVEVHNVYHDTCVCVDIENITEYLMCHLQI